MSDDDQLTWHISTVEMYPAIMDKLVSISARLDGLASDVSALRADVDGRLSALEGFRAATIAAAVVFTLGLIALAVWRH